MPAHLRQTIGRTLVAVAWPAVLAGVLLLVGARWYLPERVEGPIAEGGWTRRSRAAFVPENFYPAELDQATGQSFSWSRDRSELRIDGLRRARAHRVTLTVRGIRQPGRPAAQLRILVDGRLRSTTSVPGDRSDINFEIPRAAETGTTVVLEVPDTYTPGGADPRALGVIVDRVALEPVNGPFVPRGRAIGMLALAALLTALALRCCGLRGVPGALASAGVATAYAWLLLQDAAFLGAYADRLAAVGAISLALGAVVLLLRIRWPALGGVSRWGTGAALVLAASVVKLGVFWHPLAIVGDGIFQVHRAQVVHGGQFFFTSVTPKPFFEFPYPVALYVFALPFWNWFPSELDLLRLLRSVAIIADGVTGVMLFGALRRQWPDRSTAFWAAALWPLAAAPMQALSNANLTNLFGQSVFGASLAALAWMAAGTTIPLAGLAAAGLLLTIAFLSHFGTLTVGLATMGVVAGVLLIVGQGHVRRLGVRAIAVVIVAMTTAWLLYYSHPTFRDVYRRSATAVAAPDSDDSSKIVASPAVKLERWWSGTGDDYGRPGIPLLLVAAVGAGVLIRRQRTGAGLVFLAWVLAWVALWALGVLTPLTLRANLAAAPAFIALGAVAIGEVAARSRGGVLAAVLLAAVVAWDGGRIAVACLQLTGN